MRSAPAIALALAWALAAVPLPSQTPSAPPAPATQPAPPQPAPPADQPTPSLDETFIETINVRVVNVDVYVTDKQGNRVRGLQQEDFEIRENGKPIQITNFYAVDGGRP